MAKKTNVSINGKEYFKVTRTIGHKVDGIAIKKTFYGSSKKEAEEKANEYMNKLEHGMALDYQTVTIDELIYKWLFQIKLNELKPSSFQSYEGTYRNYIKDSSIAGLPVYKAKSIHIQEYYNKLGKTKTFSQIKKLNKLLKSFFFYAENEGYIIKNPCKNITIPNQNEFKNKKTSIQFFTEEEIDILKLAIKGHRLEHLILTAIGTGLRQGELLALQWKNVNLKDKYIKIEDSLKTVYVFDNEGNKTRKKILQKPKSKDSERIVYLPDNLVKLFTTFAHNGDFVFHNEDGSPMSEKTVFDSWKRLLKNNNIPHRKFHALRHTYASLLLLKGVDLKTVQELMGHSDITITQIYLHIVPKSKTDAVNRLNSIFNDKI